ncbi:MAG: hypothetical protein ABI323_14680 [Solirubrobacteraceae bacterium]
MNEPPGVRSVLGIEAVEWVAEGGENIIIRVTGRWRRRRPAWSAQPTLVIEATGRRYRFPATAEPPSLSGAGPGTWRISFSVPAALAPELSGRSWLQFGAVIVPLPTAVHPPGPESDEDEMASTAPPADLPPPRADLQLAAGVEPEAAVAPADAAVELVAGLEASLREARTESERLAAVLADQQLARRAAEQGAQAERMLRTDLGRQLNEARQHIKATEGAAVAAETARAQAEVKLAELVREHARERERGPGVGAPPPAAQLRRLTLEQDLVARRGPATRIPHEPVALSAAILPPAPLEPVRGSAPGGSDSDRLMVDALHRELSARALAETGMRARLIEAEARLAARDVLAQRTGTVLRALRDELDELRAELARERAGRQAAEAEAERLRSDLGGARTRTQEAHRAIAEVRGTLEALRGPGGDPQAGQEPAAPTGMAGGLEPERLSAALSRLREQIAPQENPVGPDAPSAPGGPGRSSATGGSGGQHAPGGPGRSNVTGGSGSPAPSAPAPAPSAPAPPPPADPGRITVGRPWLRHAFRSMARSAPERAGHLILDLLPAQRAVVAEPIAYDLELGPPHGCLQVTVRGRSAEIIPADAPRGLGEVDFRFTGEPADLGRLIRAGRLRRRFGRHVGRVQGRRSALAALDALVGTQLGLGALSASGVRLDPRTALDLLAKLIPAAWAEPERFTLAYVSPGRGTVYLLVDGHQPIQVGESAPRASVATTITGPAGTLELVLLHEPSAVSAVSGDGWPVTLLREWVKRAQTG